MEGFCNIYNLFNLIKVPRCYKNPSKPIYIDLMLTNSLKTFFNSCAVEIGLSDFHKMTITIMKATFLKQETKIIYYRDLKIFQIMRSGKTYY